MRKEVEVCECKGGEGEGVERERGECDIES